MTDRPWMMRTYSGHSSAEASNALYRANLAKGQTGLSIAFDLPTQTGLDPDGPEARGEVGRTGVPVAHLGHMRTLMAGVDPAVMNTSMTINATAPWLLGLYVANADEQGAARRELRGTTQNDIVKEYLSRGTYIFPPAASRRLTVDVMCWCAQHCPNWNPINVCSYHLQEAGATPVQEIAYALATAIDVLDAVRDSGQVATDRFDAVVGSVSFFVNAGIRFIEEACKVRAFTELWDELCRDRYGVTDPARRRFRYGVQVNSLGLTAQQPENNVVRVVLEMLAVTLGRRARARSIQLPCWNEALGLPRPWDQQWSLRAQQILAYETDLLEHEDVFEGSHVIEARTAELREAARAELAEVIALGGSFAAIETLKGRLVASMVERTNRIERGEQIVVGVNRFTDTEASPLGGVGSIERIALHRETEVIDDVRRWKRNRDRGAVHTALDALTAAARSDRNIMDATIELARAGGTTGEWGSALRAVFGDYRGPTGVSATRTPGHGALAAVATRVASMAGGPPRLLVAKPGLDGHSNGAEQVAVAARDAGMEVVYTGIRVTTAQIAATARDEDVDVVGLSLLSGAHLTIVPEVIAALRAVGSDVPVVVGGIIPDEDRPALSTAGVAAVFTQRDYELATIMATIADVVEAHRHQGV
jgi:ethylmalonyl-CoA mutase